MRFSPIVIIAWGILFLGGYLFADVIAMFCGLVVTLFLFIFAR